MERISRVTGYVVLVGALILAVTTAVETKGALERSSLAIQSLSRADARAAAVDQLMGQDVSLVLALSFDDGRGPAALRRSLLWIVDANRCPGCLYRSGSWNLVQSKEDIRAALVVSGVTQSEAEAMAREVGIRGRVVADPSGGISATLGSILPDTRVLVAENGIVLLAESRYAAQMCAWSFLQQVSAVQGWTDGTSIRKPTPQLPDTEAP